MSSTAGSPPSLTRVPPAILHGDYRIGNMQFDGERLAAIIDWEIWSLGDPRNDLAWLLTWLDPVQVFFTDRSEADERAADAPAERGELIAAYQAIRPGDLPDLAGSRPAAATRWPPRRRCWSSTTGAARPRAAPRGGGHDRRGDAPARASDPGRRGDAHQPLADVAPGEHVDQR